MVFKLLVLCRGMPHHCTSRKHQVRPCFVERLVNEEVFLLKTEIYFYSLDALVKQICH